MPIFVAPSVAKTTREVIHNLIREEAVAGWERRLRGGGQEEEEKKYRIQMVRWVVKRKRGGKRMREEQWYLKRRWQRR